MDKSRNRDYCRPLTDEELLQLIESDEFEDLLPVDNSQETDVEFDFEEEGEENNVTKISETVEGNTIIDSGEKPSEEESEDEDVTTIGDLERKWQNVHKTTETGVCNAPDGINETAFSSCKTILDVFLKILGDVVDHVVFESNLYATQKSKNLNLTRDELLCFIRINFLMGYHQLPNIASYWSLSKDLHIPIIGESMSRNRFTSILSSLHANDNSLLSPTNTDKLYKVRPLIDKLNKQFSELYNGTRQLSVDESIVKFKGRSTMKQYNPQKPIKRGYKLWVLSDQYGFVKKFDVYQGKHGTLYEKYKKYQLGERVVLYLTEEERKKNKILYFDKFFNTIRLLKILKSEQTLACGTIRTNRVALPKNLKSDKQMNRGDFEFRLSNTGVSFYKWRDNRTVTLASNFHGSEDTVVKRKEKNGTNVDVKAPKVIQDYNNFMGGVDHHDRLRATYTLDRRSKNWWHHLFWAFIEIVFVNTYIVSKYYLKLEGCSTLLQCRRELTLALLASKNNNNKKRHSQTSNKRPHNFPIQNSVRLANLGVHWPKFSERRGRCELCRTRNIQSKPHSQCSSCGVYLCVNEKKNCFFEYHNSK